VITLALAVAVAALAKRGALVKRLSAVETLGSTDVICTDKTGTLTENRMSPVSVWTLGGEWAFGSPGPPREDAALAALAEVARACNNATMAGSGGATGDPTEIALLRIAATLGAQSGGQAGLGERRHEYGFDPRRR